MQGYGMSSSSQVSASLSTQLLLICHVERLYANILTLLCLVRNIPYLHIFVMEEITSFALPICLLFFFLQLLHSSSAGTDDPGDSRMYISRVCPSYQDTNDICDRFCGSCEVETV